MQTQHTIPPPTDERGLAALRICTRLHEAGFRALLAGGCVRDLILGVEPRDYDIATNARREDVAGLFEKSYSVGAVFGIETVIQPEGQFEVATFRKDGPYLDGRRPAHVEFVDEEQDAQRRDFTINAMFFDPQTNTVLDYVGGRHDLRAGIVRTVGEPRRRFDEDHLRLLRAIRFAARLDYAIAPDTFAAICEAASLIRKTSAERIRDELLKMLTEGHARRALERLDETGLLGVLLPEVARMKGVQQPSKFHPEGDVFEHTLLMFEHAESPSTTLAMGMLLHDVGKPLTQTFEDRIRFNNHDKVGAREAVRICRRLHMSKDETTRIVWLVANHMRLAMAPRMRQSKLKRFVREEGFPELLELCRLDCMASHLGLDKIRWLEDYLSRTEPEKIAPPPLLTGKDLIAMGYQPGPVFSEILRALEDAQLEGNIATADEARRFVKTHWRRE